MKHGLRWRFGGTGWLGVSLYLLLGPMGTWAAEQLMVPGIPVPKEIAASLEAKLEVLGDRLVDLSEQDIEGVSDLLPDVEIFYKAVDWALHHNEFIRESEWEVADALLDQGLERAAALAVGDAPWTHATGLVVRGYRSRLDDSVQPYGLVVPESYRKAGGHRYRADVWLHGRDNRLTELKFLHQRQQSAGQFAPRDAFVLHPYGRFCNAFKFAGEVDVFEALASVSAHYPIDESRVAIRGFSMGGAGCWHLAVHHPGRWVAAAPGAGFAESAEYLGLWRKEPKPTWYQQSLWHLYDATDYALNLAQCPTVAYSGGADKQIQAAQVMETALEAEGLRLRHVIGPDTGHRYHPVSKVEVAERVDAIVRQGQQPVPRTLRFTTWTLRYPSCHWVHLTSLERHWERARVVARLVGGDQVELALENVNGLRLRFGPGEAPFEPGVRPRVRINGTTLSGEAVWSDGSWEAAFEHGPDGWRPAESSDALRKVPGLQGPIDDAFFDRFVIVEPDDPLGGTPSRRWIQRELERMKQEWRAQFRGVPLTVKASALTAKQIEECHLLLWGDPETHHTVRRIQSALPVRWSSANEVQLGERQWDAEHVVPLLIFPNPLNPKRYVVLNSGFTFRGYGSNATQVPMLPDYALVDVREPENQLAPGKVVAAGFFDEHWQLSDRGAR